MILSKQNGFFCALFTVLGMVGCKDQPTSNTSKIAAEDRPNIVLLLTDDQSYKALRALGNNEIRTPAMDNLADNGVTFTNTYNMGGWNGAICVASRAMIISGRSIWRAQQISNNYAKNQQTEKTWPKLMESAGYDTYMTGKWHVQVPPDSIFNNVKSVLRGMPWDTPEGYHRPRNVNDTLWQPWKKEFGGFWKGGKHWSELVRDDALAFIDSASQKQNPFFMYIAFNAPHDPRQSPKEYVEQYPLDSMEVPKSFLPQYPFAEEMGAGKDLRDEKLAPFPRTKYAVKVNRQEYYAITTHLDDQIKKIMDALQRKGLNKNTYVFFTSDHGLAIGEHGLMGKQNMFDHSIRVPFILVGPDLPKGKKVAADIYLQDAMATALDIAGIEKPSYLEFNSVMDLAKGKRIKSHYKAIYGCYEKESQRMIRKNGFKLIIYPRAQKVLLYNLEKDPLELNNIASESEQSERLKALFKDLLNLQQDMGDSLDLTSMYEKLFETNTI
ncbi:sulfatase-like hydrolase/transferase [Spongiimicrobium sp. 3-5]|uniref:sulfatase-like hydrolase/transferase n=1 Tax=Spongiimicrobium sp. 3-5 TaxID=3332596 RepID=UPI00397F159F